jgi:hypothetical protein
MRGEEPEQLNPIYKKILIKRRFMYDVREVLSADSEEISADEAVGRISAEIKYKCPPGFPVLVYGEEILVEHVELFGPSEKLKVMKQYGSVSSSSTAVSPTSWCHNKIEKFDIIGSD